MFVRVPHLSVIAQNWAGTNYIHTLGVESINSNTLDEPRDKEKRLLSLLLNIFFKLWNGFNSNDVAASPAANTLLYSCRWYHELLFGRGRERKSDFMCWCSLEPWGNLELFFAMVGTKARKDRKIAGKEREKGRRGGKESKATFFFSFKKLKVTMMKKPEKRKERKRLGGWKCDGCLVTGWQPHTLTGFIWHHVNWTKLQSNRKNFIRARVTALRWPDAWCFLLVFTANKSSPRWVTRCSGLEKTQTNEMKPTKSD